MTEAWIELSIAFTVILLRLYFRYTQVGLRGMALDDLLIVFAGVLYASEIATVYCLVVIWHNISNNNFTPDQRAMPKPDSQTWRDATHASKAHIVGWFTYTGAVWTLKACWTICYSRMIYGFEKMNVRIKIAWSLIGTTHIATVAMILFKCWPLYKQWQIHPDPGNDCYPGASKMNVAFITALNVATDMYLMAIPLPFKKWAVIVLRSTQVGEKVSLKHRSSRDPISARRLPILGKSDAVQSGRALMLLDVFRILYSDMSSTTGGSYDGNVARVMNMSPCGSLGVEVEAKLHIPEDGRARSRASERRLG